MKQWRMPKPCADCPFDSSIGGLHMANSLRPSRLESIKEGLLNGEYFLCHKTTDETGDGSKLLCAGATDWQNAQGMDSNYQRVCERLDFIFKDENKNGNS